MPYVDLNVVSSADRNMPMSVHDGISFAHTSVQFAALALKSGHQNWHFPQIHLFALAIELGFKSLALRSGATVLECKSAGHDPAKMIALAERHGGIVPARIKQRLSDKEWFQAFLFMSRYPALSELNSSLDKSILMHPDYPEMIAEILEARCRWPLSFHRGSALEEIKDPSPEKTFAIFTEKHENRAYKAMEPIPVSVTDPANVGSAPLTSMAHVRCAPIPQVRT